MHTSCFQDIFVWPVVFPFSWRAAHVRKGEKIGFAVSKEGHTHVYTDVVVLKVAFDNINDESGYALSITDQDNKGPALSPWSHIGRIEFLNWQIQNHENKSSLMMPLVMVKTIGIHSYQLTTFQIINLCITLQITAIMQLISQTQCWLHSKNTIYATQIIIEKIFPTHDHKDIIIMKRL